MSNQATLNNYKTGEIIRTATEDEIKASREAGDEGAIQVQIDGETVICFVEE